MIASPRLRLHQLIADLQSGSLKTELFCSQFEHTYNIELDKQTLTSAEAVAFAALFEEVVWYSPLREERTQIPNYRSEEQIARAVERAVQHLGEER